MTEKNCPLKFGNMQNLSNEELKCSVFCKWYHKETDSCAVQIIAAALNAITTELDRYNTKN